MRRPRHWLAVLLAAALVASTPSFGAHAASAATPSRDTESPTATESAAAGSQRAATANQPDQSDAAGTMEQATAGPRDATGRQPDDPRVPDGSESSTQPRATQPRGSGGGGADSQERPPIEVSGQHLGVMHLEELTKIPDPATKKVYVRGNRSANGVWSDGATLWVADGFSNQARFHRSGCPDTPSRTPGHGQCGVKRGWSVPTGLQFTEDGNKIHHDTVNALTAYDLGGGYRTRTFDMPNTSYLVYDDVSRSDDTDPSGCDPDERTTSNTGDDPGGGGGCDGLVSPEGVWSDGDTVWVSDVSRVVKAYRMTSFTRKEIGKSVRLRPDRSLTMPSGSVPRGIWSDGVTIWVADACHRVGGGCEGRLVAFDLDDGTRAGGRDITGLRGYPEGVWSDGTTLWVSTTLDPPSGNGPPPGGIPPDKVLAYRFDPEGGKAARDPARDLALMNHRNATGLWSDGEQMWVADGGSAVHVYCLDSAAPCHQAEERSTEATTALIYDTGDDEVADSFGLPDANDNPSGAWSDGEWIWVADRTDTKLYAYNLATGTRDTALEGALHSDNANPTGLWSDGDTMWVADDVQNKLFAYTLPDDDPAVAWARDSDKDIDVGTGLGSDLESNSVWGIWSDGTMLWVAHQVRSSNNAPAFGKVTAFDLSDGSVDPGKTFDLSDANDGPTGISSDGTTLWVVNHSNNNLERLFAYRLSDGRHLPHKDIDALRLVHETDEEFIAPTSPKGIRFPRGLHIGDLGSGGPQRWPRTLHPDCYETQTYFGFDSFDDEGELIDDPPLVPSGGDPRPADCDDDERLRPFGRMAWLVDGNEGKVHAIRLHPALFDNPAPEDFAPSRASLRVTGSLELTLSWQPPAVGNAALSGWVVQWREQATSGQAPAPWTEIELDDPGARSYTLDDDGITAGTAYEAQVRATYADGTSSDLAHCADPASADPANADRVECKAGATAVAAPGRVNLKVIPDVGELRLSWPAPSDGGSPITDYVVQYKLVPQPGDTDPGYTAVDRDADPTALTHTISDLTDDTPYTVRVRALNKARLYGPWTEATVSPGESTLLADAVVAADTNGAYKLVRLEFNRALDTANPLDKDFFEVEIDDSGTALTPTGAAVDGSDTDTVVLTMAADIAPGVPVTVSYDDDDTNDNTTDVVQDTTGRDALPFTDEIVLNRPGPPTDVTEEQLGFLLATSRNVCWTAPTFDGADDSTLDITDYRVQNRNITDNHDWDDEDPTKDDHAGSGTAECTQINLQDFGKAYEIRVAAINEAGQGSFSDVVQVTVLSRPGEAQGLGFEFEATGGGSYDVLFRWSAPAEDGGIVGLPAPDLVYDYSLFNLRSQLDVLSQVTVGENHAGDLDTAAGAFAFRNSIPSSSVPEAGDRVRLKVGVRNGASLSLAHDFRIFVLGADGEPQSVAAALGSEGLAVSWEAPKNADRGDDVHDDHDLDIKRYEIRYKLTSADDIGDSWTFVRVNDVSDRTRTITGLGGGEHYDVQMRVVARGYGTTYNGDWSDSVTADDPYIVDDPIDGAIGVSGRQSAPDTYGLGNVIEFTATFSENVTVTGDPVLEFCLGEATDECTSGNALRTAAYSSTKSSADTAVFTYTVVAADRDTVDGISFAADAIKLNADADPAESITGTTADAVAADLSHAAFGPDPAHKVDGSITADLTPPTVASAKVIENGTKIEIVFDEPLDTTSEPANSAFGVTVDGSDVDPAGVAISGAEVTLTMPTASTIAAGATVTVAYDKPAAGPLQDLAPALNKIETFTGLAVPNRPAAPTGLTLEPGDTWIEASWTAPSLTGGSEITGYDVQWKRDTQTWAQAVAADQSVGVSPDIDPISHTIADLATGFGFTVRVRAGNAAGLGPSTEATVETDSLPVANARVDISDPSRILMEFNKHLDAGSVPDKSAFTVTDITDGGSTALVVLSVAFEGITQGEAAEDSFSKSFVVTIDTEIVPGNTLELAYDPPDDDPLQGENGHNVAEITAQTVINRPAAPVVSLTPGDTQITASWDEPANGGRAITGYRVEWRIADSETGAQTWDAAAAASQFAETATGSHTITSLTNDTEYTVRVHAVNADDAIGPGPWSDEVSAAPSAVFPAPDGPHLFFGDMKVLVRWIPPARALRDTGLEGWLVQWKSGTEDWHADRQVSVEKFHDIGAEDTDDWLSFETLVGSLTNDTAYTFRVQARVAAGRTALWTAEATATPKAVTPDVPEISESDLSFGSVELGSTANGRVDVHFHDEPTRSVNAGLVEYTVRRTFYFADHLDEPAYPITELNFHVQPAQANPPPERKIATLHEGADPDDWGGFDYPPSHMDIPSSQFKIRWNATDVGGRTANGDIQQGTEQDAPLVPLASVPQEKAVLGAPVALDGALKIVWQDHLWAGTELYDYELCVQWKSGAEEFDTAEALVDSGEQGLPDRTRLLTDDERRAALIAASFTLTTTSGLTNGTSHDVRVVYCNDADEPRIDPNTISNVVSGTPVDLTAPTVVSARVIEAGAKIEIVFDEDLDTTSVPAVTAFDVEILINNFEFEPISVEIPASAPDTVILGMPNINNVTGPGAGLEVKLSYTAPSTDPLKDTATPNANQVASFVGQSVLNRPFRPGSLTLTLGTTEIEASWTRPILTGGSAVTGYEVEYKLAADSAYTAASRADDDTSLSETITGLTGGTTYTVRVRAVNAAWPSDWTEAEDTTLVADETAPMASATGLEADADGDYKIITITFDEALDDASVPANSAFGVTVDGDTAVNPSDVAISGADVTLTMDAEIVAGATVTVTYDKPTANPLQDLADDPDPNAVASFTGTDAIVVPNRPAAPALTLAPAAGQITASWDAVTADGGSTVTDYEVQYKAAADSGYTTVSRAVTAALSETITSLVDGTSYTVRVRAVNNAGAGPWAEAATVAGDAYPAPDGPWLFDGGLDGGLNDPDIGEVLVRWLPPTSAASDTDLQGWEIQWRSGSEEWSGDRQRYVERDRNDGGLSFESEFGRHSYGTEYEFRVRARVTGRASLWTDAAAVTVTMHSAPANMSGEDAYFGDHNDEPSDDTVSEKVIVRFYDSLDVLPREVVDRMLGV